jgi:hypothetical protein
MFILIEKIAPPPRQQIFNDAAKQEAALAKLAEDERWVKHIIDALAGRLRISRAGQPHRSN